MKPFSYDLLNEDKDNVILSDGRLITNLTHIPGSKYCLYFSIVEDEEDNLYAADEQGVIANLDALLMIDDCRSE